MELSFSLQTLAQTIFTVILLYGLVRLFVKRSNSEAPVNWTPVEALCITVTIYFLSQVITAIGIGIIGGANGLDTVQLNAKIDGSVVLQSGRVLSVEAITIGMLLLFLKQRQTAWRAIGWVKPKLHDIGYALIGFGIYFTVYALAVFNIIRYYFPQIDTNQTQELGFNTSAAGPDLILIFLCLVILPPVIEEILVRGFLFTGLKAKLPLITAAIVTSLVFAAAHLQWGNDKPLLWTAAADTFVLSMVLVWLRQKTGSLWPGIGVHFIKNGLAFLVLFIFKVT